MAKTVQKEFESEAYSSIKDYFELLKPRVLTLVVFSSIIGYYLAPGEVDIFYAFSGVLAIVLGSGSASAFNMWYEHKTDSLMQRTSSRPIPSGRIPADDALVFAIFTGIFAVLIATLATNTNATLLLVFSMFFYGIIYTVVLKPTTVQNIVIGGAAGAFPPMIGWLIKTGEISLYPFLLFLIIFIWTPSHFWALSLLLKDQYKRANIPMMPVIYGRKITIFNILVYSYLLLGTSLLPYIFGYADLLYIIFASFLGFGYIYYAYALHLSKTDRQALELFKYSILYLFTLFSALAIDKFFIG